MHITLTHHTIHTIHPEYYSPFDFSFSTGWYKNCWGIDLTYMPISNCCHREYIGVTRHNSQTKNDTDLKSSFSVMLEKWFHPISLSNINEEEITLQKRFNKILEVSCSLHAHQLHEPRQYIGSLKLTMVEIFLPQKSVNVNKLGFLPLERWLLSLYQETFKYISMDPWLLCE